MKEYCKRYKSVLIEPITEEIIEKAFQIDDIPELHDRIIAGTSLNEGLTLITNDPIISESKFIKVIW